MEFLCGGGYKQGLSDEDASNSQEMLMSAVLYCKEIMRHLDWLKSYYWESQKNMIPFQRDRTTNMRKEIKSKVQELAFHLNLDSSPPKRKSPKGQIRRSLRVLVQLYASFPKELVTVLLEFLMKALDSSDGNLVELSNTSGMEPISGNSKFLTGTTDMDAHYN